MRIIYHKTFLRHFKKRIVPYKNVERKFYQRLRLLMEDPHHSLLRRHQLRGKKRVYWSFSVTGDIRVIYRIENNILFLYDIGSHAQVY